eukprot:GHVO01016698.1.p1 GENE.GHVO01016698.1~~GHVO01016698.1.p1  ORF type:complete len:355 (+),score=45.14 GHVO01016698.1:24-1067(+)
MTSNEKEKHYLSGFTSTEILVAGKVPALSAEAISRDVLRTLTSLKTISAAKIEEYTVARLQTLGFEKQYQDWFSMLNRFYKSGVPLILFVIGPPQTRKTRIARILAERLRVPNVIHTKNVLRLMQFPDNGPVLNKLQNSENEDRIKTLREQDVRWTCPHGLQGVSGLVHLGLKGDMEKASSQGKSVVVVGSHIDPIRYVLEGVFKPIAECDQNAKMELQDAAMSEKSTPHIDGCSPSMLPLPNETLSPIPFIEMDDGPKPVSNSRGSVVVPILLVDLGLLDRNGNGGDGQGDDSDRRELQRYLVSFKRYVHIIEISANIGSEDIVGKAHSVILSEIERFMSSSEEQK